MQFRHIFVIGPMLALLPAILAQKWCYTTIQDSNGFVFYDETAKIGSRIHYLKGLDCRIKRRCEVKCIKNKDKFLVSSRPI